MIQELVTAALLGTRGSAIRLPALPAELSAVLPSDGRTAESQLLDAAAAVTLYARAGVQPQSGVSLSAVSPGDQRAECRPRAADILAVALDGSLQPLVAEWLELANRAGVRVPHRQLVRLLETAAAKRSLRVPVNAVIDERGRWLMQFNPRWQFARPATETPQQHWQLGSRQLRGEALRTVRETDPQAARELIAATWKDDPAEERAEWVACLRAGLSSEDEAFLETCLDDRSSRVRETAADLLARLPASQLVRRMTDRVAAQVTFHAGSAGQLLKLKRASKPSFEVTLPAEFDKSLQRDGLSEKPNESLGPKQWWLMQVIGYVPLEHWTKTYRVSVLALMDAVPSEFRDVFVRGWQMALARQPEVEWIEPLLEVAKPALAWDQSLLHAVPPAHRLSILTAILKNPDQKNIALRHLCEAWQPLDKAQSQAILAAYDPSQLLAYDTVYYLHAAVLPRLQAWIIDWGKSVEQRRAIDHALSVITLRLEMHKEFAK